MKKFSSLVAFYIMLFAVVGLSQPRWLDNTPHSISSESQIWGKWKYIGFIYKGQFQVPPNPNLVLTFEFLQDGTDVLKWHYLNEDGFCERKGEYSYNGKELTDKIVWVNPKNSIECNRDPDMIAGRTQITPVKRVENQLHLDIPLSDDTLIYILALNDNL